MSDITARKIEKSRITGDLESSVGPKVRFRLFESRFQWVLTLFWSVVTTALTITYVVWLILAFLNLDTTGQGPLAWLFVLVAIVAVANEIIRMPLIITLCITSLTARKPVPVYYDGALNAVIMITFVPGSEDIERLRQTLIAAKAIITRFGRTTILVLDEGIPGSHEESPVKFLVDALNGMYGGNPIVYFSRLGIRKYNKSGSFRSHGGKRGQFEMKTKHGNLNAGLDYIMDKDNEAIFGNVDVVMGLDPDHIPVPEFRERLIGPLNDPNVAYVTSPQAYENAQSSYIAHFAESSQTVFYTLIQPSANLQGAAMLVGTNYAFRLAALKQIGYFQRSITEDLKTTGATLSQRNPVTGAHWRSVATPDVLAHGDGPDRWGSFISQQLRWAVGAMVYVCNLTFAKHLFGMRGHPRAALHYLMIMPFYFIMGLSWLLAAVNIGLQMGTGLSGAVIEPDSWIKIYGFVMIVSLYLYTRQRRFNVSPFESVGFGMRGVLMGVMCAPLFAHGLWLTFKHLVLRRKIGFDVTPKGVNSQIDTWYTFRLQLSWMAYYCSIMGLGVYTRHINLVNFAWALIPVLILALPILMWVVRRDRTEWKQYKSDKKTTRLWRLARKKVQRDRRKDETSNTDTVTTSPSIH